MCWGFSMYYVILFVEKLIEHDVSVLVCSEFEGLGCGNGSCVYLISFGE